MQEKKEEKKEDSSESLCNLNKNDITELHTNNKPVDSVRSVVKALFLINKSQKYEKPKKTDEKQEYIEFKKVLNIETLKGIHMIDVATLNHDNMH